MDWSLLLQPLPFVAGGALVGAAATALIIWLVLRSHFRGPREGSEQ
jgi:hypothetical protein